MAAGSVQEIVICRPAASASAMQQAVCPKDGLQFYEPITARAYLLDPAQQNNIDAALGPFDYAYASGLWAMAFSMVVGLYFVSQGIGQVLGLMRRG